jgi:predicted ATP-binding protein involved in virulence
MKQKPTTKIDALFTLQCGLTRNGDVKLEMDYVDPDLFTETMKQEAPDFDGTFQIASLLRYLKTAGSEVMEKAYGYVQT